MPFIFYSKAPTISHLFFADDSLLFTWQIKMKPKGYWESLHFMSDVLGKWWIWINVKFLIVETWTRESMTCFRGSWNLRQLKLITCYLGLPTFIGRSKKVIFQGIHDRVWKRFKGWKKEHFQQETERLCLKEWLNPFWSMLCNALSYASLCVTIWKAYATIVGRVNGKRIANTPWLAGENCVNRKCMVVWALDGSMGLI